MLFSPKPVLIREMKFKDIRAVMDIAKDTLNDNTPMSTLIELFESWKKGFMVVERNKEIAGFLLAIRNAPGESRIIMFAILEKYRSLGLGTMLLDQFIRMALHSRILKIRLEVRKSNRTAIKFYSKRGFKPLGVIRDYYPDGEDGYLLVRNLQ